MLHELNSLLGQFSELAKANPVLATIFSVYGLGIVTFLLRNVPAKLALFTKTQLTTTLTFDNSFGGVNEQTYARFMQWYQGNKRWMGWSRALALTGHGSYWDTKNAFSQTGIGNGYHFFFYHGRPFWLQRTEKEKIGASASIFTLTVTSLGRSHKPLMDLIEEFKYVPPKDKQGIYSFNKEEWGRVADIIPRRLETVIINRRLKTTIVKAIELFKQSEAWYTERGLPYKQTFLLYGEPGTGKTSLIKGLASHFGFNICQLQISNLSDGKLESALTKAPENSVIIIEDFDSASATRSRANVTATDPNSTAALINELAPLTLSGILNALDGIVSLHSKLVFLTTNVLDKLDSAITRAGRVDFIHEIKRLEDLEIREYIELMFSGTELPTSPFKPITGAELQALYLEHRLSAPEFIAAINRHTD